MDAESPEEDGLAARTLEVLRRGGASAALALLVVTSVPLLIGVVGAWAALWFKPRGAAAHWAHPLGIVVAVVSALSLPVALHAGPLAVFALALETRARLGETLGVLRCGWRSLVVGVLTTAGALCFFGVACGIMAFTVEDTAARIGLAPIALVVFVLGVVAQGGSLVFLARAFVTPSLRRAPRRGALHEEVACGLALHGVILAVGGPSLTRGFLGSGWALEVTLVVALVAVPLAAILGSAIAVAVAGRPRALGDERHGT